MNTKKTILVVGGTGLQGSNVCKALVSQGYKVLAVTRNPTSPKAQHVCALGVELVEADIGSADLFANLPMQTTACSSRSTRTCGTPKKNFAME